MRRNLVRALLVAEHWDQVLVQTAAALSGAEAAELRRWIRGPEGRGRRGRGLEARLMEVLGDHEEAAGALIAATKAAAALPGEG